MTLHLTGNVGRRMLNELIAALEVGGFDTLAITSQGGDPDIALAIAGLVKQHNLNTAVYGQCYSAATVIFAAGTQRKMQRWAFCMVHESADEVSGNASAMKHQAKYMERYEGHWNAIMAELTGTDAKVWEKLNERDTYLNAEECLKLNLATEIF